MNYSDEKMSEFVALLDRHTPQEGPKFDGSAKFMTYRESGSKRRCASVYQPAIFILGQGEKQCSVGGQTYDYSVGNYLTMFLPMPVNVSVVNATPDNPLLMMGIKVDLHKIANLLLRIDQVQPSVTIPIKSLLTKSLPTKSLPANRDEGNVSSIFAKPLHDDILDSIIRLLRTFDNPLEQAVLGESILEEIYFRLICDDHTGMLKQALNHHGQVQQIAKVVNHIQNNMDEVVSVDKLAGMVNMSTSGFRKTFRQVMHMPPLQYAKLIKLDHAQVLISEGKNANEAGYMVGYNSPAQFSREYKRHFGISPSAQRVL